MLTQSVQDYLKAIYKLGAESSPVNTNAIAERLQVSQASVTGMIKKLAELKLITHQPYYGVELTEAGRRIALEIIRHHRLLELYLAEALGYPWDRVHDEAEKLEHHISEEFEARMAEFLGHPEFDPHGAPIPNEDGTIVERQLRPLTEATPGTRVRIEQVSDRDPEMLRYLDRIGMCLDCELEIIDRAPFGGPLTVQLGQKQLHLGEKLTDSIFISEIKGT
ncbi:MAG: metal-dependent transcriptional regulator [Calditrichaeota bacterium]|nr:MAG: metal-dependent transcriptional regulator [Calditrichota bacterium]